MTADQLPAIWWVRRDLRLRDNPALAAAVHDGSAVLPVFILDPALLAKAGPVRTAWLHAALQVLDADLRERGGPGLSILRGKPETVIPRLAREIGAGEVQVSADFAPYGRRRDERVRDALAGRDVRFVTTGSPYGVAPGTLTNASGGPYQVFTPFFRAWTDRGVHSPAPSIRLADVDWLAAERRISIEADPELVAIAGEEAATRCWHRWLERKQGGVTDYADLHDDPGADATSHLSVALRWGHLHPRTLLADLAARRSKGSAALTRQLAWRDFFADVLFHRPDAVTRPIRPEFNSMPTDEPDRSKRAAGRLEAWQQGRTGYPLVDAGMRQLLVEGWMHNRVRMVVASFLVKDLHVGWWHGAEWFMARLRDGDIAQNQLNWQWVAGCGTDAAPYFRVFNPTSQAKKFDPGGTYIRRYVSELADVPDEHVHEPWLSPVGVPDGYPEPIVDHAEERKEALDRYELVKRA
ncbi:cryptochrome/photolyase family protein [Microlunatus ginsengisoli]|uniref:Deoxyribodipyrimidine photo-lyase n=1 Tax=Microlunatus ginsengisoli TaxID=363863 RepID=A0ABP6ZKZ2_9ACTN